MPKLPYIYLPLVDPRQKPKRPEYPYYVSTYTYDEETDTTTTHLTGYKTLKDAEKDLNGIVLDKPIPNSVPYHRSNNA